MKKKALIYCVAVIIFLGAIGVLMVRQHQREGIYKKETLFFNGSLNDYFYDATVIANDYADHIGKPQVYLKAFTRTYFTYDTNNPNDYFIFIMKINRDGKIEKIVHLDPDPKQCNPIIPTLEFDVSRFGVTSIDEIREVDCRSVDLYTLKYDHQTGVVIGQ